jgi:hypothetical protein
VSYLSEAPAGTPTGTAPGKNWCRACRRAYDKHYAATHPEAVRAKQKRYEADKPAQAKARKRRYYRQNASTEKARSAAYYAKNALKYSFTAARRRAVRKGLAFTLVFEDLVVPTHCPVLGIRLAKGTRKRHDNSPSLDRLVPERGYVPGNVAVISLRANTLKNSGTAEEHRHIADWMDRMTKESPCPKKR